MQVMLLPMTMMTTITSASLVRSAKKRLTASLAMWIKFKFNKAELPHQLINKYKYKQK